MRAAPQWKGKRCTYDFGNGHVVIISDDDWEPISPVASSTGGSSQVASDSMVAVAAGLQPPPPMGGVGGTGMVRARVAEWEPGMGAVVSRTFPPIARTTAVDAETQTGTVAVDVGIQTEHTVFPFVWPGGGWTL